MTVAAYVKLIEERYTALLGIDGDRLLIVSDQPLPRAVAVRLAGYAPQLIEYFETTADRELSAGLMSRELAALGLIRMHNGEYTHSHGDEVADLIIAGVLGPETPLTVTRREQLVEAVQVIPGMYRWREQRGVKTVPMRNGRRLLEK